MTDEPVWTDDALSRLLGTRDGYVHSLLAIRATIHRFHGQYTGQFHPRHVRKIARRDAITKPLRELEKQIEADMIRCRDEYQIQYDRAHPRASVGTAGVTK
jgi:hypothetical protein